MKIRNWKHEGVKADGTFYNQAGAIHTEPLIRMSSDNGGCGLENCSCSEGHWLMIGKGRDPITETVEGMTIHFDNYGEMQLFLTRRELS